MSNGVDVQTVLEALAKKIGELVLEAEVAKLELQKAMEERATLINAHESEKQVLLNEIHELKYEPVAQWGEV